MIELVPAIDIIDRQCVRLSQGDYGQKTVYCKEPLDMAKKFEAHGVKRLHLVDLDGAKAQHIVNYKVLEQISAQTKLVIDFGGGLKSDDDLRIAFESGAAMITGGSIAVKDETRFCSWIKNYGPEKIILGADVRDGKISVSGWCESTDAELLAFLEKYTRKGITQTICTDISKDGMLQGTAIELYQKVLSHFPDLKLIASGGVASWNDIEVLEAAKIPTVIFGKAFYEGKITLKEIENYNLKHN